MKERPILFSAPMVRAILEGRKTQTRRALTFQNSLVDGHGLRGASWAAHKFDLANAWIDPGPSPAGNEGPYLKAPACDESVRRIYPRVWRGDRLWVRETWREREPNQDCFSLEFRADRPEYGTRDGDPCSVPWHPSIHMPRWASRINLEVTGVRVERLQQISEGDAADEGVGTLVSPSREGNPDQYRKTYRDLWGVINGPGSWAANPWVWVVEFKKVA